MSEALARSSRTISAWLLCLALCLAALAASCASTPLDGEECSVDPSQAFRERILPVLSDDRPSTCNQCHLAGLDLSAFVRRTPCETLACLRDQGLVDLERPASSRVLGFIGLAKPDSALITKDVIAAEYSAFYDWIEANAACSSACRGVRCGDETGEPLCDQNPRSEPSEGAPGVQGCGDAALERSFSQDVYAFRGRCSPCHFDTEKAADPAAPRWISGKGDCASAAVTTLHRVVRGGYLNLEEPEHSLLLLKPLDSSAGGVPHGGGNKFSGSSDPGYSAFLRFIRHYAECKASR